MSEHLSEMEEGGQGVNGESAVDVTEQQHSGSPPLQPGEEEASDKGSEEHVGTGQLSDEGKNDRLKTDNSHSLQINGENTHGEEGIDMDGSRLSSDDEEGKSQNGVEDTPAALASSAKPTRLVQLPLARVKK